MAHSRVLSESPPTLFLSFCTWQPFKNEFCFGNPKNICISSHKWNIVLFKIRNIGIWKVSESPLYVSFPHGSDGKESACSVGDLGSIPGLGSSSGEGNGNPFQYSCLEDPMDGGVCLATVHGVTKSWTELSDLQAHTLMWRKRTRGPPEASWAQPVGDFPQDPAQGSFHHQQLLWTWAEATRLLPRPDRPYESRVFGEPHIPVSVGLED